MKRVRINVGKVAIVSKNGDYNRLIMEGSHWLSMRESMTMYRKSELQRAPDMIDVMLKDATFNQAVEVIEIADNQIALSYTGKNFAGILRPGRYFYFKGLVEFKCVILDMNDAESINASEK